MPDLAVNARVFQAHFQRERMRASCLCHSTRGIRILAKDRYGIPIEPMLCADCGHVYARYRLSEKAIEEFYSSSTYRMFYSGRNGLKGEEAAKRKPQMSREVLLPLFRRFFPGTQARVVIEWGCSGGWNLIPFQEAAIESFGLDVDREYVEYGRREFGLSLLLLDDVKDPLSLIGKRADFLILNHVLEHTVHPMAMLTKASRLIAPGGYIFVGLPFVENLSRWGFKRFFHIGHLHYFTMRYFKALARQNGFDVVEADLSGGYAVLRVSEVPPSLEVIDCRVYTASLLLGFGLLYMAFGLPYRLALDCIKRAPALELSLKRLRNALLHIGGVRE